MKSMTTNVWGFLVLLLAAASFLVPSRSDSATDKCRYQLFDHHQLDVVKSKLAEAVINVVGANDTVSLEDCATACCGFANCTTAKFNPEVQVANCIFFQCIPVKNCKLEPSRYDGVIVYRGTEPIEEKQQNLEKGLSVSEEHAVKNQSMQATDDHSTSDYHHEELTLLLPPPNSAEKHIASQQDAPDVAHNSVVADAQSTATSQNILGNSNSTIRIKKPSLGRKGAVGYSPTGVYEYSLDADKTKGTKPRKGVINETIQGMPNNNSDTIQLKSKYDSNSSATLAENLTLLKSSGNNTSFSSLEMAANFPEPTILSNSETPSTPVPSEDTPPYMVHFTNADTSSASSKVAATSSITISSLTSSTGFPDVHIFNNVTNWSAEPNITNTRSTTRSEPTLSVDDNFRKYTANIHLIIALVIGLMILLTVFGLVVRRVYDVWTRRHYHRMDFLIDGMYNSMNMNT